MSGNYIAHLASDADRRLTACGEPWQGWQEPFDADLATPPGARYVVDPPHHYDPPRPHQDRIRQCQACLRVALTTPTAPAGHRGRSATTLTPVPRTQGGLSAD